MRLLFQVVLLASFAMWFGGFGFYASFVVPVGNEVLGSFEQATVTRQVTVWLNWLGLLAGGLMLFDAWFSREIRTNLVRRVGIFAALMMLFLQGALFWLHPQIDALVDLKVGEVLGEYDQFYWLHRVYLWTITFQWIASWIWLGCFVSTVRAAVYDLETVRK